MIRVVFDTSVLYSAVFKQTGLPAAVFDLVVAGLVIPCVSPAVLAEYREVLLERPALRPHRRRALQVLDSLDGVAILVVAGLVIPCVSPAVLAEYREVLLERPALRPHRRRALQVLDSRSEEQTP